LIKSLQIKLQDLERDDEMSNEYVRGIGRKEASEESTSVEKHCSKNDSETKEVERKLSVLDETTLVRNLDFREIIESFANEDELTE